MDYSHRKTRRTFDVSGDAHFVTFSCFGRLSLLSKDRTRSYLVDAIGLARQRYPFDLWAYVIMPEHVHLVLLPAEKTRMRDVLSSVKQSVSKKAIRYLKEQAPAFLPRLEDVQPSGRRTHRFWQRGGGYDRNLRSVRDIHEKIAYTHENPVRRGLVDRPCAWKWSSAAAWELRQDEPLSIDRASVPPLTNLDDRPDSKLWR